MVDVLYKKCFRRAAPVRRAVWNGYGLTPDQEEALRLMLSGRDCHIDGGAGTGKSHLIKEFSKRCGGNVFYCAPTGVAAWNIGGATIHSAFRIPVKADIFTLDDIENQRAQIRAKCWNLNVYPRQDHDPLLYADVIVIDEISMCRGDLFGMVMASVQEMRAALRRDIQVVLCGDFAQLPPVLQDFPRITFEENGKERKVSEKDRYIAEWGEGTGFAFLSPFWKGIESFSLSTVVRQKDAGFSSALNRVRMGEAGGIDWIAARASREPISDAIWVCGRNDEVEKMNAESLDRLPGRSRVFTAEYSIERKGKITEDELEKESGRIVRRRISLKEGCAVVVLVNRYDNGRVLYTNGMRGVVTNLDNGVTARFDNGREVKVERHTWDIQRQTVRKTPGGERIVSEKVASFSQLPLAPGYAATVHKSQGQTLEAINVSPNVNWSPGQLYVALSRCKDASRIHLPDGTMRPVVAPEVINFYRNIEARNGIF